MFFKYNTFDILILLDYKLYVEIQINNLSNLIFL
jgi:hypothetical protein